MRTLLLHRDFVSYTGGHGKFLDYIAHVQAHPDWQVRIHLSERSLHTADNPFLDAAPTVRDWCPAQADALLLGGTDWRMLEAPTRTPVINLVQHVRHADPGSELRGFLPRRAVRVCVSHAVARAIGATGEVNGPLRVIPAALDLAWLSRIVPAGPPVSVFVDATKQPLLGSQVGEALRARGVDAVLATQRRPRPEHLAAMAAAGIVVTLPDPAEGFYLPGLEAMALGRVLVQYDCRGSAEYVQDGINACVPARSATAIASVVRALLDDPLRRARLAQAAQRTAARFDLARERSAVHALLDQLEALWAG